MHKLFPVLLLLATAPIAMRVPVVAEMRPVTPSSSPSAAAIPRPDGAVVFVGGMGGGGTGGMGGGMTGGGMGGGMTGGGMGGMTGGGMGGMTGGGMGGMSGGLPSYGGTPDSGMGGMGGGLPGYGGTPGSGMAQPNSGDVTSGGASQPAQHYQCVTQQGQCSVASSPGSLRHGASCSCLYGGLGKIK
jgi:hypothetical protein